MTPADINKNRRTVVALVSLSWFFLACYFAWLRSLWSDELEFFALVDQGLIDSIKGMFRIAAPYNPGEMVLSAISRTLFSNILPLEIWTRFFPIVFATGTVAVATDIGVRKRLWFLPLLVYFSVSLMWFAGEFRPYAALIFGGAWTLRLMLIDMPLSRFENAVTWLSILFGHLYGICFTALALVFRKDWLRLVFCVLFVIGILKFAIVPRSDSGAVIVYPPATDMAKQILAAIGNPKKATLVYLPMFLLGFGIIARSDRKFALRISALLFASIAGPLLSNLFSQYLFWPRQFVGALFSFVFCAAVGFQFLYDWSKRFRTAQILLVTLAVLISFGPWLANLVLRIPPFPNRTFFEFREISSEVIASRQKQVLMLDVGNYMSFAFYLSRALNEPIVRKPEVTVAGISMYKVCLDQAGVCVYSPKDMNLSINIVDDYRPGGRLHDLVYTNEVPFDLVIYHTRDFVEMPQGRVARRYW